jgi:hypothetical protein
MAGIVMKILVVASSLIIIAWRMNLLELFVKDAHHLNQKYRVAHEMSYH